MSTYEQLRDSATGEAGEAWKAADREAGNLYALYRELQEDPRFTSEHKAETAWKRYDAAAGKVEAGRAKARELLQKQARSAETASLPFPPTESPGTEDTNKLIASQNEASRIVRKLDRMASGKGPFKPDKVKVLKGEYERGLEAGGVQGGAICRGVLAAANELGIDADAIVDAFRKDRHHEALERAEHCARLTQHISTRAPEPPFPRPGARRGSDFHTGRTNSFLPARERTVEGPGRSSGRRPPWS
jgi:hypothetical protein